MKVMFVVFFAVVGVVGALRCHQGKDAADAKDSTECPAATPASTQCHGPVFTEYTGYSVGAYACGPCEAEAKTAKTCEECELAGCNDPVADTHTFECPHFKYDTKKEKFAEEETETTCNANKDTNKICNSNGEKADKTYIVHKLGCGPCVAQYKTALKCKEYSLCEADNCNSAATITAFLLPMIALFYTLF